MSISLVSGKSADAVHTVDHLPAFVAYFDPGCSRKNVTGEQCRLLVDAIDRESAQQPALLRNER